MHHYWLIRMVTSSSNHIQNVWSNYFNCTIRWWIKTSHTACYCTKDVIKSLLFDEYECKYGIIWQYADTIHLKFFKPWNLIHIYQIIIIFYVWPLYNLWCMRWSSWHNESFKTIPFCVFQHVQRSLSYFLEVILHMIINKNNYF